MSQGSIHARPIGAQHFERAPFPNCFRTQRFVKKQIREKFDFIFRLIFDKREIYSQNLLPRPPVLNVLCENDSF